MNLFTDIPRGPISTDLALPQTAVEWWLRALAARYAHDHLTARDAIEQALAGAADPADGRILQWSAQAMKFSSAWLSEAGDVMAVEHDAQRARTTLAHIDTGTWPGLSEAMAAHMAYIDGRTAQVKLDFAAAAQAYEQAVSLFRQAGLLVGALASTVNEARMLMAEEDHDAALEYIEPALNRYAASQQAPWAVRWVYAQALVGTGQGERALPVLAELIEQQRALWLSCDECADVYRELGRAHRDADFPRGAEHFASAAKLYAQDQLWDKAAAASLSQSRLLSAADDTTGARTAVDQAHTYAVRADSPVVMWPVLMHRVEILVAAGDKAWMADAHQALEVVRTLDNPERHMDTLWELGEHYLTAGDLARGEALLTQRSALVRQHLDTYDYVDTIIGHAYLLAGAGGTEQGLTLLRDLWARRDDLPNHLLPDIVELSQVFFMNAGLTAEWETWQV